MSSKMKNNVLADKFRASGTQSYRECKYFDALLDYNHSLCFAEPGTEQMGLAYANRSAAYIELGQFDLCLYNIHQAKVSNYPSDRMFFLVEREKKCKKLMKRQKLNLFDDPFNFFKLSYPVNLKYPEIAECIELQHNKKFGRYLVTTKDLKTGDVIAIEDPSFTLAHSGVHLHRCSYCCKDVRLNLFPCAKCSKGKKNLKI